MEYSKKTRDAIQKILTEEEEYPFKTLKNKDLKDFPKGKTLHPRQCGHCGCGMSEGYYVDDDFYACSQHCMLSILYNQESYYWTSWEEHSQENLEDGDPVYDTEGNSYYLTENFDKIGLYIGEDSFNGSHYL